MAAAGIEINEAIATSGLTAARASQLIVETAQAGGLSVIPSGPSQYQLTRRRRPGWVVPAAIVGAVLFLGLGLLLLVIVKKQTELCTVTVAEDRRGVTIRLTGVLAPDVLDRLRMLGTAATASPSSVHAAPTATGGQGMAAAAPDADRWSGSGGVVIPPPPSIDPSGPVSSVPGAAGVNRSHDPLPTDETASTVARPAAGVGALRGAEHARVGIPRVVLGGQELPLAGGLVIGRRPTPPAGSMASPMAIQDLSLSKTHLELRVLGEHIEVRDLASTNGTTIEADGSGPVICPANQWVPVVQGSAIVFGEQRAYVGRA